VTRVTRVLTILALVATLGIEPALGDDAGSAPSVCPKSLFVREEPENPAGWLADTARTEHPFERISIFEGAMGEQHKPAPVELAPDAERREGRAVRQTWKLERDAQVLLVCRYRATRATLAVELSRTVRGCEQTLALDKGGRVDAAGPSTMMCR
jgi:hypothetical protein